MTHFCSDNAIWIQFGFNFEKRVTLNFYHELKTRIGFVANNQHDCRTPDSCIGFGTTVKGCGLNLTTTCGNLFVCGKYQKNNNKDTAAFGFILVQ